MHLARDCNNGKVILSVGGRYVDECILTTHTGGDSFPKFGGGVHIAYRVRFQQEELKLLKASGVLSADAGVFLTTWTGW